MQNILTEPEKVKDIEGYEGLYSISNTGIVINMRTGKELSVYGKTYSMVSLSSNGKRKIFYVHRLVASAFIQNDECKTQVNHKDGNKMNNHYLNLEWVTSKENVNHAIDNGFFPINTIKNNLKMEPKQNIEYSFKKGFMLVPLGVSEQVKKEIMAALGIKSRVSWGRRLRGLVIPKVDEAESIEKIFAKHGIPKSEIWGT